MSSSRWSRTLAVALCMAACGTTAVATAATAAPAPRDTSVENYWTAERLAAAKPVEVGRKAAGSAGKTGGAPRSSAPALGAPALTAAAAPSGTPQGKYGDGIPMVGTFFAAGGPSGNTYCTASVVQSAGRNLVLTAGHCALGKKVQGKSIFIPQYRKGKDAAHQPFGVFPVQRVFTDPRYSSNSTGADSDLDFGFIRVGTNAQGARVQDLTGSLRLTPTPRWNSTVTVTGYPVSNNADQRAISCTVPTKRLAGYRQVEMRCGGFYSGVSGSPWIANYDAKSRTGDVIGNLGGYNGGGNTKGDDWVNYSPVYDRQIQALYQDAVADRTPARDGGAYRPQSTANRLPGAASTWRHAKHLAAGDYTGDGRDDLLTLWSDGEVSLYPGDGKGGFGSEKTLAKAGSFWSRAEAVTAGDFTGSNRSDLVVRWSNGKVSLFADGDPAGFGKEYTLAPAGSSPWKYATQITAGKFNSTDKASDLVVRWADGGLSLYSGVSSSGLGTERRLAAKDSFWKNSIALASTQPAGQDRSNLMVRWADGSLGSFALSGSTLSGTRLQAPNASWQPAVMVAGDFTTGGRRDDLVVRWSDGESSLYDNTTGSALGTWTPLLTP
ncbi:FG-GAP-like repeat-containing protein [Streptomyces syringium]|uniref:FG-GAP-like repeat-containing protein n=1 Tax=Streptomyces syringium TaxID=76729 RepID=UPI003D914E0E